eukprot:g47389.t1
MGNTLSCCVSPGASPTLSGRGGLRGQERQQQKERIDAYRVEAELREPEPSPGTNLQHISDREAPEGGGINVGSDRMITPLLFCHEILYRHLSLTSHPRVVTYDIKYRRWGILSLGDTYL